MKNPLIILYSFFAKNKIALWLSGIFSFLFFLFFSFQNKIDESVERIFPNDKNIQAINHLLTELNFTNKYTILLTTNEQNPQQLIDYTNAFAEKIKKNADTKNTKIESTVADIDVNAAISFIQQNLPLYLSDDDYKKLDSLQDKNKLKQQLSQAYEKLFSFSGMGYKSILENDPLGLSSNTLRKLSKLNVNDSLEIFEQHLMNKEQSKLLFFLYPEKNTDAKTIARINIIEQELKKEFPDVSYYMISSAVFSESNAGQIRKDINTVIYITLGFLLVFIALFYRKKRAPFLLIFPVAYGIVFAGACNYFFKGSISIISLGAASIVVGIAINYSLHYFSHLNHNKSAIQSISELWQPLSIGSFTTVSALFSLTYTQSPILQDFGFMSAFSLIGAAFFTLVFLPHLLTPNSGENKFDGLFLWIDKFFQFSGKQKVLVLIVVLFITILLSFFVNKVGFVDDMNAFNFMNEKVKKSNNEIEKVLANNSTTKVVYVAIENADINTLLANQKNLSNTLDTLYNNKLIKSHFSIAEMIFSESDQNAKLEKWQSFWKTHDKNIFIQNIKETATNIGFSTDAFENYSTILQRENHLISPNAFAPVSQLGNNTLWFNNGKKTIALTAIVVEKKKLTALFSALKDKKEIVILDRSFITQNLVSTLKNDFNFVLLVSSLIVFFTLLLSYGRIELAIVTFLPMMISWVWILGLMGLLGIDFNLINIIISTFIFGIGDDFAIFTVDALLEEYKTGKKVLAVNRESIILALITTLLGMGVLIFAKHPALKSIAFVSIIGVFSVFIISQTLLPILLQFFLIDRKKKGLPPYTFFGFLRSVFAFFYFVFGALLLSIIGPIVFYLFPAKKSTRKYLFHYVLSKFVKSLVYIMMNVKKVFINKENLDFSTPTVIIANHQSFLDILITVMQHPKLILLTNDWVWNSPVFGKVVQMADYYPVANGADMAIDRLEKIVAEGYSIVVFPEGTRSVDGVIKRFHKGAFYIAEKLNIPITPVILHGICDTMRKGDFQLMNGTMTMKFLPRIQPDDNKFGANYSEKTKNIAAYFKQEYALLKNELETTLYFKDAVIHNYIFKGPVLEWYTKIKLKMEGYYQLYDSILPEKGYIVDVGCGYGYMDYLLIATKPNRQILGLDFDEEKIAVAANCYAKKATINFSVADILNYEMPSADVFIFNDVMHYLPVEKQQEIMLSCFNKLNDNGMILLKDGNSKNAEKHKYTKFSEFMSTNIGFNKASYEQLNFVSKETWVELGQKNNFDVIEIEASKYTSNIMLQFKKKINAV